MNKKIVSIIIAAIVIATAGGFYIGMKYGQNKKASTNNPRQINFQLNGNQTQRGMGNFRAGANFIAGSIINKDDKSFTIKLSDGGSKIVFFSDATQFMKTSIGTLEDLKIDDNILISGSANQDGSLTAQTIQLRPELSAPSAN